MDIVENVIFSLKNLAAHPLRSILTLFGIVIGVFSLIAMIGIGEGTRHKVIADIERLGGSELITIKPEIPELGDQKSIGYQMDVLTLDDLDVLMNSSHYIEKIGPQCIHDHHGKDQRGKRKHDICKTHDNKISFASIIAADYPQNGPDEYGEKTWNKTDHQ